MASGRSRVSDMSVCSTLRLVGTVSHLWERVLMSGRCRRAALSESPQKQESNHIVVRAEDTDSMVLNCRVRKEDNYQRQQGTRLIERRVTVVELPADATTPLQEP